MKGFPFFSGGGNYEFQGDNDAVAASASFTGVGPEDLGSYIALYPYNASASYDGNYVSTTLPAYQLEKAISLHDLYYQLATHTTASHAGLYNDACYGNVYRNKMDEFLRP